MIGMVAAISEKTRVLAGLRSVIGLDLNSRLHKLDQTKCTQSGMRAIPGRHHVSPDLGLIADQKLIRQNHYH